MRIATVSVRVVVVDVVLVSVWDTASTVVTVTVVRAVAWTASVDGTTVVVVETNKVDAGFVVARKQEQSAGKTFARFPTTTVRVH